MLSVIVSTMSSEVLEVPEITKFLDSAKEIVGSPSIDKIFKTESPGVGSSIGSSISCSSTFG